MSYSYPRLWNTFTPTEWFLLFSSFSLGLHSIILSCSPSASLVAPSAAAFRVPNLLPAPRMPGSVRFPQLPSCMLWVLTSLSSPSLCLQPSSLLCSGSTALSPGCGDICWLDVTNSNANLSSAPSCKPLLQTFSPATLPAQCSALPTSDLRGAP